MSARLPRSVRSLIRNHVGSVGELELLLTLRSEPDRAWTAADLSELLDCPPSWATLKLQAMSTAGLVEQVADGSRFAPTNRELQTAIEALDEAYRLHRREVLRFVFTMPARDP